MEQTSNGNKLPRGYRNNNPLNIRRNKSSNRWTGYKSTYGTPEHDPQFVVFETMAYGFRAAMCLIKNYIVIHGLQTIPEIIGRWAPESENNTKGYIRRVLEITQLSADYEIDPTYRPHMLRLVYAMATVENGMAPDAYMDDLNEAWKMFVEDSSQSEQQRKVMKAYRERQAAAKGGVL